MLEGGRHKGDRGELLLPGLLVLVLPSWTDGGTRRPALFVANPFGLKASTTTLPPPADTAARNATRAVPNFILIAGC